LAKFKKEASRPCGTVIFSIEARAQKAHFNGENSKCKWYKTTFQDFSPP